MKFGLKIIISILELTIQTLHSELKKNYDQNLFMHFSDHKKIIHIDYGENKKIIFYDMGTKIGSQTTKTIAQLKKGKKLWGRVLA